MSEYKEFWIDNSNETNKDFFLYNVKRGVMNYNFQGAIHVIEYSALLEAQQEVDELKTALIEARDALSSTWPNMPFIIEMFLKNSASRIDKVLNKDKG